MTYYADYAKFYENKIARNLSYYNSTKNKKWFILGFRIDEPISIAWKFIDQITVASRAIAVFLLTDWEIIRNKSQYIYVWLTFKHSLAHATRAQPPPVPNRPVPSSFSSPVHVPGQYIFLLTPCINPTLCKRIPCFVTSSICAVRRNSLLNIYFQFYYVQLGYR